jgi:pantothenate synthetase
MNHIFKISFAAAVLVMGASIAAKADILVIDATNLNQAMQITQNTQSIMDSDQKIMDYTKKTLAAVTGDRTSDAGQLSKMALGSFQMGKAPDLSSIISGGCFSGMGSGAQNIVAQLINGLQLVKSISGLLGGKQTSFDKSYQADVNTVSAIVGIVSSTQGAVSDRSSAYQSGAQKIGSAPDLKGSIDQNSQVQAQNGMAINELIGTTNQAVAATNQQNLDYIARVSQATSALSTSMSP